MTDYQVGDLVILEVDDLLYLGEIVLVDKNYDRYPYLIKILHRVVRRNQADIEKIESGGAK